MRTMAIGFVIVTMAGAGVAGQRQLVRKVHMRSTETQTTASQTTPIKRAVADIARVAWISGTWIGSSGSTTVEEQWTSVAGGSLLGIGRTLRNNAMTSFEFLRISERDGTLVYTALPNGRTPTDFTLTAISADGATFENHAHDYPQVIRYARRADGSLETTISGAKNERAHSVVLKRQ
jgi:hypothetical protein